MTIGQMVHLATAPAPPAPPAPPNGGEPPKPLPDGALEKVAAFIPAEVIGIYLALWGILHPLSPQMKWYLFAACCLLIPMFLVLNYFIDQKAGKPVPEMWQLAVILVMALVAFTAWAAAVPESPFVACIKDAPKLGGAAVIILAPLMPLIAKAVGISK